MVTYSQEMLRRAEEGWEEGVELDVRRRPSLLRSIAAALLGAMLGAVVMAVAFALACLAFELGRAHVSACPGTLQHENGLCTAPASSKLAGLPGWPEW
jgi:hypothetical protein